MDADLYNTPSPSTKNLYTFITIKKMNLFCSTSFGARLSMGTMYLIYIYLNDFVLLLAYKARTF